MPRTLLPCLLLAALWLQGCAPAPHRWYFAPAIEGLVVEADKPVANSEVRLVSRHTKSDARGMTDAKGRFSVRPLRQFVWVVMLIGDPVIDFQVEVHRGDREYLGFVMTGIGYTPKHLKLTCDLSAPIPPVPGVSDTTTYCRRVQ